MCWFCLVVDALYVVHTTKQSRTREITKSLDVIVTPLSKLGEVAPFIAYPPPLCTVKVTKKISQTPTLKFSLYLARIPIFFALG